MTADLENWLHQLELMQPEKIELGLARVKHVASTMGIDQPAFKIITVAGTNGKGSTVAYTSSLLTDLGFSTGVYTSPHFIDFTERIVANEERVDDDVLCLAFDAVESARGEVDLTYFEFTTLAAIYCFAQAKVDVAILEVGLGGRLDAVNAWDANVACISSIGIDHVEWLGSDRESIGREKAGVARAGCVLVCGELDPPASISTVAAEAGATLLQRDRDFFVEIISDDQWRYRDPLGEVELDKPAIPGDWACDNAAVAICVTGQFLGQMPGLNTIQKAMRQVTMIGRMQVIEVDKTTVVLDVAHNQAAAVKLRDYLIENSISGQTCAVFACMQDKDIAAIAGTLSAEIDHWCIAGINYPRAMPASDILGTINRIASGRGSGNSSGENHDVEGSANAEIFASVIQATKAAVAQSGSEDRVVVFGSFHVVGPAQELLADTGK